MASADKIALNYIIEQISEGSLVLGGEGYSPDVVVKKGQANWSNKVDSVSIDLDGNATINMRWYYVDGGSFSFVVSACIGVCLQFGVYGSHFTLGSSGVGLGGSVELEMSTKEACACGGPGYGVSVVEGIGGSVQVNAGANGVPDPTNYTVGVDVGLLGKWALAGGPTYPTVFGC